MQDWKILYSVDLTAFTDRFPVSLVSGVLKARLPKHYVSSWEDIMVGYPFYYHNTGEVLSYAVGNPMGAYSS
jgi:hypothetical protein